ncbi:cytochrome bc complex cytochrome b subunit [Blastococcus sp. MG754426]|uniref:cytochrome bc1 complex cytochrome b subunit n=1 Tax=unclassified Blastococcus TaxID=2619396 RepID=UPI001EEFDF47|nr:MULTISPECIES: cytochrome bc complex cytochrome b subunit [unclassified Blastococcus]MCF6508359.1 cytochrome bc complex cytochrome b subunit [Blastococcus sp. MG754426]MCF6510941.1 cytochrome bc complex cytochrome b subunit [Blastococcus sp. MG754427]MCF6733978.1 cytochrome bc complex cytochrome b subunit [Blastococcus sp. KM273129]
MAARTATAPGAPTTRLGKAGLEIDDRLVVAGPLRRTLNKVFPDHWSFLLGEIALYCFIILLLSGTYLTFFYQASMTEVTYDGSYDPLRGIDMSIAYASTLDLSFDVRGGLFMRQLHHWAALMFVAAIVVHLLRIFFTGAFRRPRESNWLIGVVILILALLEGFSGYSLPDDLLSGTGLRIMSAIILAIPVVGTWVHWAVFGGDYIGELIIGRLYIAHVLLIPAILLALIAVHLLILVKQKHTQFPGPGRTEHNVVGNRLFPTFAGKATGLLFVVFGACAALGGLVQINPVWLWGPYNPAQVSAASQPDWYIMWLDGSSRLFPAWDINLPGDYTIPALFWPTAVLPGIVFTLLLFYPMIERKLTGDTASHHLLQRPRDVPVRTSLGMMSIAFYVVLLISGGNDVVADKFDISLNAMTWAGRIGMVLLPPIVYVITYRICLGLQQHDREVLEHGIETGVIRRLPHGEFIEVHQPIGPVDAHGHGQLAYGGAPVPKKMNQVGAARRAVRGFFSPVEEPTAVEIEQRAEGRGLSAGESERELTSSGRPSEGGRPSDGGRPQDPRD